jgi:hypothetical protein
MNTYTRKQQKSEIALQASTRNIGGTTVSLLGLRPSSIFAATVITFNLVPAIYLYLSKYKEDLYLVARAQEYHTAVTWYLVSSIIFLAVFLLTGMLSSHGRIALKQPPKALYRPMARRSMIFLGMSGTFLTFVYMVLGGYQKLLLIGSDIDSATFRFVGYDDRSRFLIAALELSRRIFLPISAQYFWVRRRQKIEKATLILAVLLFAQIVGSLSTLDRAPILLFFMMFVFTEGSLLKSRKKLGFMMMKTLILVAFVAGLTTFLQYNLTSFSLKDIFTYGEAFLVHRTAIVPSIAAVELSYYVFPFSSPKLFLSFSRLGALFGAHYVGSHDENSRYVSPVGALGDIWRNFGLTGIIVVAFLLGIIFSRLDIQYASMGRTWRIVSSFSILSLGFYYVFGVFFSQGVFAQMFFTFGLFVVFSRTD